MISRSRSAPTAAAMSIECTTSANSTVTCLYSADRVACVSGAPHSLQNLEFGGSSVPHDPQNSPVAVSPPPPSPLGSTSVSFHRWSAMSVISPCHLRHEVLRPSYVVCFESRLGRSQAILRSRLAQVITSSTTAPHRGHRGIGSGFIDPMIYSWRLECWGDSLGVARSHGKSRGVGLPRCEGGVLGFLLSLNLGDMSVERTPLSYPSITLSARSDPSRRADAGR